MAHICWGYACKAWSRLSGPFTDKGEGQNQMEASGMDGKMFSLFMAGGAGILLIISRDAGAAAPTHRPSRRHDRSAAPLWGAANHQLPSADFGVAGSVSRRAAGVHDPSAAPKPDRDPSRANMPSSLSEAVEPLLNSGIPDNRLRKGCKSHLSSKGDSMFATTSIKRLVLILGDVSSNGCAASCR
jgi:hypothetical protein